MTNDVQEILKKIKVLVCSEGKYRLSRHASDYIDQNLSSRPDIEHCIRYAKTISGIEKDTKGVSVDGFKYTIKGASRCGTAFYTTGLIIESEDGEIYFFITAHEIKEEK